MELLLPGSCLSALLLPFLPDLSHGPPIWSPWLFFLPLPHSNKAANHYNWHHADQLLQCRRSSSSLLDTCNLLPPYNFVKVTQEWETTKNSPHLRCESKWRAPCCLNLSGIVQNIPFNSSCKHCRSRITTMLQPIKFEVVMTFISISADALIWWISEWIYTTSMPSICVTFLMF